MLERFFWQSPSYRWLVLIGCVLIYICSQVVRWNYASITPFLVAELEIGKPELGLLGSAFFFGYAAMQVPWGIALDRLGGRKVLTTGFFILSLFLIGFAFASTFTETMTWRIAMGAVAAAGFAPSNAMLSKWFEKKERAFALGTYSALGGGLGEGMSFILIPFIVIVLGGGTIFGLGSWRGATVIMAFVIMLLVVIAAFLLRSDPKNMGLESIVEKEDRGKEKVNYRQAILQVVRDPSFWLITICFSVYAVGSHLVPAWLTMYGTAFYLQTTDMSKEAALLAGSIGMTCYIAGRLVGTPLIGKLSDYLLHRCGVSRITLIAGIMGLTAAVFYCFTLPLPSAFAFAALSFVTGALVTSHPLINAICAEQWSIRAAGFNNAMMNMVGQISAATVLAMSGFWAVKFSRQGEGYWLEFAGIWYLGLMVFALGSLTALVIVYRERSYGQKKIREELDCS